jgi:hypothetical protein
MAVCDIDPAAAGAARALGVAAFVDHQALLAR